MSAQSRLSFTNTFLRLLVVAEPERPARLVPLGLLAIPGEPPDRPALRVSERMVLLERLGRMEQPARLALLVALGLMALQAPQGPPERPALRVLG